jgi:peptidyl-prolyl cis-trans isomerase B (cyclophilin B)
MTVRASAFVTATLMAGLMLPSPIQEDKPMTTTTTQNLVAEMKTSAGTLVFEFYPDSAPKHVQNFVKLAKDGFYDDKVFHRIIPGFMIQGGCPDGDGTGGPGYKLKAEFNDRPHVRGTLAMARSGHPDSAGSQFFICHAAASHLDNKYTNFGKLLQGYSVLDAIAALGSPSGQPSEPVVIETVTVRERTAEDTPEEDQ